MHRVTTILEEVEVEPVDGKLRRDKSKYLWHKTRINSIRTPQIILNYGPNEQRQLGRPVERVLDVTKIGLSRPNSWQMMMMTTTMTTQDYVPKGSILNGHCCKNPKFHISNMHYPISKFWIYINARSNRPIILPNFICFPLDSCIPKNVQPSKCHNWRICMI
jgi:hypothetical protein